MPGNHQQPAITVKLCSDRASFEARATRQMSLNMNDVKRKLEESGKHHIMIYTPHLLIFTSGKAETTLSKDGRMLIKRVQNQTEAEQLALEILHTVSVQE